MGKKKGYGKGTALIVYAFLVYFMSGIAASIMNVGAGALQDVRGWSATTLTSFVSLGSIANIVAGFVFGRLSQHKSAKTLSMFCIIVHCITLFVMGATGNMVMFVICLVLANGISNAAGYQLSPVLISKWFPKRKGIVMGIVTIGIPLCSGFSAMIFQQGYNAMGLMGGFLPFIVISALALVVLMIFITDNPADKGFVPDNGMKIEGEVEEAPAINKESIWTTSKLLRTPQVWIHGITLGTQMLFASGLMVQLYPRLLEIGCTPQTAALMMLASGLLAVPGSYLCGVLDSKIGARKAACTTYICGICAIFLNLSGNTIAIWISLAFIGMVVGGAANWPASLCIEEFGSSFANGYGVIQPIIQLVGAAGPAFFALVAGATGSYKIPYICGAVVMAIGLIAFVTLAKPGFVKKEEEKVNGGQN